MKSLILRDQIFGEGIPKICIPIKEDTLESVLESVCKAKQMEADCIELRADFFSEELLIHQLKFLLKEIRHRYPMFPVIFTYRSAEEGGEGDRGLQFTKSLYQEILPWKTVDLLDLEVESGDAYLRDMTELAHHNGTAVLYSKHVLKETPEACTLLKWAEQWTKTGADMIKISTEPKSRSDVAELLKASALLQEQCQIPIIAISSGRLGAVSRLTGEYFGSALVFSSLDLGGLKYGQIPIKQLRHILTAVHEFV